ncbi:hypothetical protein ACLOJK_003397 [Asimina triloba]
MNFLSSEVLLFLVVKTVYASPSRVDFQLDSRKAAETIPAYPNICFAVDDFESTFDAVVKIPDPFEILTESDHCFCVLLDAHDGAAFPSERVTDDGTSSKASASRMSSDSGSSKPSKEHLATLLFVWFQLTLFSGFVSYQMVRESYDAGKSRFGSLLSIGHGPAKPDRLYMRGPGGRGEVEVAVSGIAGLGLFAGDGAPENIASTKDLDNEGDWVLVEGRSKKGLFSISLSNICYFSSVKGDVFITSRYRMLLVIEILFYSSVDQSQQDSGPPSPLQISKRGFGIGLGTIVRKAASAASVAAKHAYAAAASARKADEDMLPLKCCLMSISLPWEYIAHDLLLKPE